MIDFNLSSAYNLSDSYSVVHNVSLQSPQVVYVYQNELIIILLTIIALCQIIRLFILLQSWVNKDQIKGSD